MNILSIDASTHSSGWAVYEEKKLVDYGCITSTSQDLVKRICIMINGLYNVLKKYQIDEIYLEEVRPEEKNGQKQPNIKTYKALMYLQAAIVFLIHDKASSIKIKFKYPSEWRSQCGIKTGRGITRQSLKEDSINFVKNKYNILVNDDIADAIGIGYSVINTEEMIFWD